MNIEEQFKIIEDQRSKLNAEINSLMKNDFIGNKDKILKLNNEINKILKKHDYLMDLHIWSQMPKNV